MLREAERLASRFILPLLYRRGSVGWSVLVMVSAVGGQAAEHRGTVRAAGLAIPGATVTATQAERELVTWTNEAGTYRFDDLAPGAWTLEVEMFGFESSRREVEIRDEGPVAAWTLEVAQPPGVQSRREVSSSRREEFRRLLVNQVRETEVMQDLAALPDAALPSAAGIGNGSQDANQSFLVTGSLSRGLQAPQAREDPFGIRNMLGGGGPGGQGNPFGATGGAPNPGAGPGARGGGPGGAGRGRFGGGRGRGGRSGGGGRGGGRGGRGGPRAGRGRGGPDGPGGRKMTPERRRRIQEWMRRRGTSQFGNRIGAGRNSLRAMAFFSLRNSALDARPYSLTGQTVDKPSYAQNQFGGMLGGPLKIPKIVNDEKTFFFFFYRGARSRNPFNATSTLPSALERGGDFSQSVGPVTIFDPTTRQPFPNHALPASRIDTAAQGLLPFFPSVNQLGQVQNYQFITAVPQNNDNFSVRLGRSITEADRLNFSYNIQMRDSESAQLFGFRDAADGRAQSATLGWTHNFRPDLINNLRFTYTRNRNRTLPFFAFKDDVAGELGITGTSRDPANYGPPNLSFTNFGGLTDGSAGLRRDQTFAVHNGVTLVRGNHNLSIGGDYRRIQLNNISDQNARGSLTFSGLTTSAFNEARLPLPNTGFDFADFLLGLPQSSTIRFGNPDTYFRAPAHSLYGQDDWRIRSNFTVNFGLRYEFLAPFQEKFDRLSNLDVAPGFSGVAPVFPGTSGPFSGTFPDALIEPDRNNLAPRLGLAWKPFPKHSTLVRAGYGWYYNGSVYNQTAMRLGQQPPFATTTTLTTSIDRTLTLQEGFAASPSQKITNSFAVARDYLVGYAQTWNLAVQQEMPGSMVFEVGYLGTKGTRLDIQRSPNRAAPGSPLDAEERRQIGNAVGFTFDSAEGNSIYHAGQVRLSRRFRRGISGDVLYTWSKSIDNVSTFGGGAAVVAQNDKDLRAERGLSSFHQPHSLTASFLLTSPVGRQSSGGPSRNLVETLFRDWNFSGVLTASSGTPFTATVLGNQANAGGSGLVGGGRADASGLPVDIGAGFFNPPAFINPPANRFGNASRNTIPGPRVLSLNFGISRRFSMGERRSITFRVESQNMMNTVSYTGLGTTVNASNYGLPTNTSAMRTVRANVRLRF